MMRVVVLELSRMIKTIQYRIGTDRFAHLGISYMLCDMLGHMGMDMFIAAAIVYSLGVLKECMDGKADYGDLAADLIGIFICLVVWGWTFA